MAAISRQLLRGLPKAHSALDSISQLERSVSIFSRTRTGIREDIYTCANLDYGAVCGGYGHISSSKNLLDLSDPGDLRPAASCNSSREDWLGPFRSNPECRLFFRTRTRVEGWGISLAKASGISPASYNLRLMSTAVVTDDKLRPEVVENEESELKEGDYQSASSRRKTAGRVGLKENEVEEEAGFSIYTSAEDPTQFTPADVNKYYTLSPEVLEKSFGEGLPRGLLKEFQETKESSLLIRARVLQLFDRFQKVIADIRCIKEQKDRGEHVRTFISKPRQCLLEGFVKGGKSAALAMLVHWARTQGWLVFYIPNGREWTSIGMYFKNSKTGLWDTPIQAKSALEGFLKSHETLLERLPCHIKEPLHLGEGAGVGKARGPQQVTLPEEATLKDLVERGVSQSQAAVSAIVRLREEFNLVQEVPVLIAIDEYNSWFTFSGYHESSGMRSRRPIHARELSMVNAFRQMEGPLMMAAASSQSLAVGKLPVHLPGVPKGVRFPISRYDLEEATATLNYYYSRKVTTKEPTEQDIRKLFHLTNGKGDELRKLVRLL